jgi:hypothetical protein
MAQKRLFCQDYKYTFVRVTICNIPPRPSGQHTLKATESEYYDLPKIIYFLLSLVGET